MFSHEQIQSLNDLEITVYNYIMKNKQRAAYMKIRELADEAHVSTTTVLRFCKKAGCEGFSEFKLKFKTYLQNEKEQKPDMDLSILADYIKRAENPDSMEALSQALLLLKNAGCVLFIGVGTSGTLAKYGARYFSNVGCFSLCIDDPFTPVFQGNSAETVVVALSVSGETEQVLHMASQLKSRGCALISITNSANCTLSRMSDCSLTYYMPEIKAAGLYEITSQVPVLCLIEMLGRKLYRR